MSIKRLNHLIVHCVIVGAIDSVIDGVIVGFIDSAIVEAIGDGFIVGGSLAMQIVIIVASNDTGII